MTQNKVIEPYFICCECGAAIVSFEDANDHMRPTKENDYGVHKVVPVSQCTMCPAKKTCTGYSRNKAVGGV